MSGSAPTMLWVCGASRSGTTMLGRVFGQHSAVHTFNELHFFEQQCDPAAEPVAMTHDDAAALAATLYTIEHDGYFNARRPEAYAERAEALTGEGMTPTAVYAAFMGDHDKAIGCDQTPRNLYVLAELLERYPGAKAVIIHRDPRDVMLSQKKRWQRRKHGSSVPRWNMWRTWAQYHPWTMSRLWRSAALQTQRLREHPRVEVVRFEDLLQSPEQTVARVCERLGLAFEPGMLDVPRVGSSNQQDASQQRGIDPSVAGRWRTGLTPAEAEACQRINGDLLPAFGYEAETLKVSPMARGWLWVLLGLKMPLAVVLNARRLGKVWPAIRRRLAS